MMTTMRPEPRSRRLSLIDLFMSRSSSLAEVIEVEAHVPDVGRRARSRDPPVLVVVGRGRAVGQSRPAVGLDGARDSAASDRGEGPVRPAEDPHPDLLDPGDLDDGPIRLPRRPAVEQEVVVHVAVVFELEVLDVTGQGEVDAVVEQ